MFNKYLIINIVIFKYDVSQMEIKTYHLFICVSVPDPLVAILKDQGMGHRRAVAHPWHWAARGPKRRIPFQTISKSRGIEWFPSDFQLISKWISEWISKWKQGEIHFESLFFEAFRVLRALFPASPSRQNLGHVSPVQAAFELEKSVGDTIDPDVLA